MDFHGPGAVHVQAGERIDHRATDDFADIVETAADIAGRARKAVGCAQAGQRKGYRRCVRPAGSGGVVQGVAPGLSIQNAN